MAGKPKLLTQAEMKQLLHYDPETGIFTWVANRYQNNLCGKRAGCAVKRGKRWYRQIRIGVLYYEHRLAWLYMTGEWPDLEIDHKNVDGSDNRWSNLRLADRPSNMGNTALYKNNTSGKKGVWYWKERNTYQVNIHRDCKKTTVGYYPTLEEAAAAYEQAAKERFGEFARTG